MENYVQKFSEVVFSFQERVDDAILCSEEIDRHVAHLGSCEYSHETFSATLEKIQKAVDDLNLHSYSNLEQWVDALDARVSRMHTTTLVCEPLLASLTYICMYMYACC